MKLILMPNLLAAVRKISSGPRGELGLIGEEKLLLGEERERYVSVGKTRWFKCSPELLGLRLKTGMIELVRSSSRRELGPTADIQFSSIIMKATRRRRD